jgi:hypothetical protein
MPKNNQRKASSADRKNMSTPVMDFVPAYEEVQRKAYQIHEQKGGSDFENWLEAERILKEEHQHAV